MTPTNQRPVRFAAIGLDHAHIVGHITGLLAGGCELVGSARTIPKLRSPRRSGNAGPKRDGEPIGENS